ncbi:MAG TPA: hypothetical protein VM223_01470 [Planctomycetota bacterium]|nr:hypothetical protein [Planctomycetota bacterium]
MERETGTFTQERERVETVRREEEKSMYAMAGGSATEALLGAGAVVLSILGLLNILPQYMASISVIALGAALLIGGGALAARFSRAVSAAEPSTAAEAVQGGVAMQALAGAAVVVLGILALLGTMPATLLAISLIVIGGGSLLSSSAIARVNTVIARTSGRSEFTSGAAGIDVIVGLGAIVLGILALAGFNPATLILVGTLSLGAGLLLSGSALPGRAMSMFAR